MDINEYIEKRLWELQDLSYKEFHGKLMPYIDKDAIIGVRVPAVRALAKEVYKLCKENPEYDLNAFLDHLPHKYYEENNVHAFLIEQIKDYDNCIMRLDQFLPYVDNWATCDSMTPKIFKKYREEVLQEAKRWMISDSPYMVRFGIETIMKFYLDDAFEKSYLEMVCQAHEQAIKKECFSEEDLYYIRMMTAWFMATALAKQYESALPVIVEKRLDQWTHNKAIQKSVESYRLTNEQKEELKGYKQK